MRNLIFEVRYVVNLLHKLKGPSNTSKPPLILTNLDFLEMVGQMEPGKPGSHTLFNISWILGHPIVDEQRITQRVKFVPVGVPVDTNRDTK